jgi:hypothetical protein
MTTENPTTTDVSPRSISPDGTVIGTPNEKRNGGIPDVDLVAAAAIKPSRLRGRSLMFMVTFVAGTGVSRIPNAKLIIVYHVRIRSRCLE